MMLRPAITEQESRQLTDLVTAAVHRRTANSLPELLVGLINGFLILDGTASRFYHVQLAIEAARQILHSQGLDHVEIDLQLLVHEQGAAAR